MKSFKRWMAVILIFSVLLTGGAVVVQAQQKAYITFEGNKTNGQFYFGPGSEFSLSDLFTDLKDLMPGDVKSQSIRVTNNATDKIELVLYVRSNWIQTTDNDSAMLEDEISINFTADGNAEKFDSSPVSQEQLDGWVLVGELNSTGSTTGVQDMSDWTYLGILHMGGQVDIKATVNVPLALDNTYQDKEGEIEILVQAEANPDSYFLHGGGGSGQEPQPSIPGNAGIKTGDTASILLWLAVAVISEDILILLWRNRKKSKEKHMKEAED